jgi:hypothetical protein
MLKALRFTSLAVGLALASVPAYAAPSDKAVWYAIYTSKDTQVGFAFHDAVPTADGFEIIDNQEIDIEQEGSPSVPLGWRSAPQVETLSRHTVLKENAAGEPVSMSSSARTGHDWSRNDARFADGVAEIVRTTPSETRTIKVLLPRDVRFDTGDGLLPAWDPATTPKLEFDEFDIDAMGVVHVVLTPLPGAQAAAQDEIAVLRQRYVGNDLRSVTRLLLDRDHRIVEVTQPMFGSSLVTRITDERTAEQIHWALRPLANTMTKSPYRISRDAIGGHIRYRFSFHDGIQFPLPETGEQRVASEPGFATVDICADCGPGLPSDAATLADALKPTAWLQSDDPKLHAIADPIAKLSIPDTEKMDRLLKAAKPFLGRVDFVGHYSALETMSRRAADCTDAAVLLAALGRAAGIPTRVASGLVYSREEYHGVSNAFMPHSWTLAWVDGKWRSFDLALDDFDSTHIALTIGDGDEQSVLAAGQLAGLLGWETMTEVRTAPAD